MYIYIHIIKKKLNSKHPHTVKSYLWGVVGQRKRKEQTFPLNFIYFYIHSLKNHLKISRVPGTHDLYHLLGTYTLNI